MTVSIIGDDFEAAIRAKSNCKKRKKDVEKNEYSVLKYNYVNKSNIYDIVAMLVIILDLLNAEKFATWTSRLVKNKKN